MKENLIVTGYFNPDLDATACTVAYAEYLHKQGRAATPAIFGAPSLEAEFVLAFLNINPPKNAAPLIHNDTRVVLVDASDLAGLAKSLKPEQVVEIIDHRKVHEAHLFPNAQAQIELVGSAATLIAEKFFTGDIPISEQSAALLYSAIISNTVNFHANVTTERDRKMAKWLQTKVMLPTNYIHQMFAAKSQLKKPLKEVLHDDLATFNFSGHPIGIAQLEIVGVDELIKTRLQEIKQALLDIQAELHLDMVFLTAIDLELVTNTFVVVDTAAQTCLEQALLVKFNEGIARKEGIMMRKTIVPLIKSYF